MSSTRKRYFAVSCLALMVVCLTAGMMKWHFGLRDTFVSTRATSGLHQQIKERQQEITQLYTLTRAPSDAERNRTFGVLGPEIGCSDLSGLTAVDFLGAGYTKMVLKVVLAQGSEVALKTVNKQGTDMKSCLEDFRDQQGCQDLVSFKLRKEILLLQKLQHPNIVQVIIY